MKLYLVVAVLFALGFAIGDSATRPDAHWGNRAAFAAFSGALWPLVAGIAAGAIDPKDDAALKEDSDA